jgi:hypothetical protein
MLEDAENALNSSQNEIEKRSDIDESTNSMIKQLQTYIKEAVLQMDEQKKFLNEYFMTKPMFRKSLFYKYYWFGIPLK